MNEKAAAMKPDQAWEALGGKAAISRRAFYAAINRGEVPHVRCGRRILIPRQAFYSWLSAGQKDPEGRA